MTLRTRLLLGLLALSAIGLATFGAVTYHYTKTYVYQQVDDQLSNAINPLAVGCRIRPPLRGAIGSAPIGSYAELRDATGNVVLCPGLLDEAYERPQLPATLHLGKYTVGSPPYRIEVFAVEGGGQFVVAVPASDAVRTMRHLLVIEFTIAAILLVALAFSAWWVVKIGLKPLEDMEVTAGAIAAGDLSRRVEPADETTEVGRLGLALNEMLIQIEKAFDERAASEARLRRFVGDASHELRTPLTSIRGYAELFRRGAAERPEDLAKAMRRIEEEANRMGVMVDDLLLLARLDQGRPLDREPVDLTRLARDAVDDTRTIAPSRPIDYSPNGPIVVPGDEVRLRQVLGNLLQNAVRHTPPETPVHVAVDVEGDDAILEVRDEGPGMSQADAARVFERFYRSDESRARTSGGTGLGLAIVSAIAQAHGGSASVITAPGQGATFRVRLPRSIPAPQTN